MLEFRIKHTYQKFKWNLMTLKYYIDKKNIYILLDNLIYKQVDFYFLFKIVRNIYIFFIQHIRYYLLFLIYYYYNNVTIYTIHFIV